MATKSLEQPRVSDLPANPIAILVVDDDADCRMLIREAIAGSTAQHRIFEVADGQAALDFIFRRGSFATAPRPGLVYLDLEMPGLTGQDVLRQIKSSPEHRDIPVVMMTGVCDEEQMAEAARNGANSYTIKAADAGQFLHMVLASTNYWIGIHQRPQRHLPAVQCRR